MQVFYFLLHCLASWIPAGEWKMPRVHWRGGSLFCDQVALVSEHHLQGRMRWVMGFRVCNSPVLLLQPEAMLHCLKYPMRLCRDWPWWVGAELVGRSQSSVCGFALLPIMVTALPQLPCLCISTLVAGISLSVQMPLSDK